MTNNDIKTQLLTARDKLLDRLTATTLSKMFKEEYKSIRSGQTRVMGGDVDDILEELKELASDTSHDRAFAEKVKLVHTLNTEQNIQRFAGNFREILNTVETSGLCGKVQSAFIMYDAYDLPKNNAVSFYGLQQYPELEQPEYLPSDIYSDCLLMLPDKIDFTDSWPDCEEFDWTLEHIEAYSDLHDLFRLNSRVLLHEALALLEQQGEMNKIVIRPFYFYVEEHDMEVSLLYKL